MGKVSSRKVIGLLIASLLTISPIVCPLCPSSVALESRSIALFVSDMNSLDAEEQYSIAFAEKLGYEVTPLDGDYVVNNLNTLGSYDAFWSNSNHIPSGWDNEAVMDALRNELSAGKRMLVDNAGMFIAQYLGYGTVVEDAWSPAAVDGAYLVDFSSSNPILSDLSKWDDLTNYNSLSVPLDESQCLWMTQGQGPWEVYRYYPSSDYPSTNQYFVGLYYANGWDQMVNSTLDALYGFTSIVGYPGRILFNQYSEHVNDDECKYCLFKEQTIGLGKIIVNGMGQHGPGLSKECTYGEMGERLIANELKYIMDSDDSVDAVTLEPPRDLRIWAVADAVHLTWKPSASVQVTNLQYEVLRGSSPTGLSSLVVLSGNTLEYWDVSVSPDTNYYYAIRTKNLTMLSSPTAIHKVTTQYEGMNEVWSRQTVDTNQSAGWFTSMDVDSLGFVHISYENYWDSSLKYATNAGGYWHITQLEGANTLAGERSSLAIDSQNTVHIVYEYLPSISDSLRLMHTTYEGGQWNKEVVDTSGTNPSIAFDSYDNIYIGYYRPQDESIRLASKINGTWSIQTIEAGPDSGSDTRIAVDRSDVIHVVYADWGEQALKYVCLNDGAITRYTIDTGSNWIDAFDLAVDSDGVPHVVLEKEDALYLVTFTNAFGWVKHLIQPMVDNQNAPSSSMPSIAITPMGTVCISYADFLPWQLNFLINYKDSLSIYNIDAGHQTGTDSCIVIDSSGTIHITYLDFYKKDLIYTKARFGQPSAAIDLTVVPDDSMVTLMIDYSKGSSSITPSILNIYRGSSPNSWDMRMIAQIPFGERTYIDTNVTSNRTYYYMVGMEGPFGWGKNSSMVLINTIESNEAMNNTDTEPSLSFLDTTLGQVAAVGLIVTGCGSIVYTLLRRRNR